MKLAPLAALRARLPRSARARALTLLASATSIAAAIYACVPADTRPVPATLNLAVAASPGTADGLVTADGWALSFDRVLLGIGRSSISSSCARYSEASYDRLLEVSRRGPQKLSVIFGIGHCDVRFRVGAPSSEALLGEGTSDADAVRMRTRAKDRWVNRGGVALEVLGSARRGGVTKEFDLVFRTQLRLSQCSLSADAGGLVIGADAGEEGDPDAASILDSGADAEPPPPEGVGEVLESEGFVAREIRVEAETLFQADDSPELRFDPYAEADVDGDGRLTLEELVTVPVSRIRDSGPFEAGLQVGADAADRGPSRVVLVETLGDYVVIVLLPRLLRYGPIGRCATNLNLDLGRDGGGGGRGGGGP